MCISGCVYHLYFMANIRYGPLCCSAKTRDPSCATNGTYTDKNYAAAHCPFACFHVFALISCCTNACFVILYVICVILNLRDGRTDEQAPGIEFGAF